MMKKRISELIIHEVCKRFFKYAFFLVKAFNKDFISLFLIGITETSQVSFNLFPKRIRSDQTAIS